MANGKDPGKHRKQLPGKRDKKILLKKDGQIRILGLKPGTWFIIIVFLVFLGLAIASQVVGH